jgi:ribosomal protein S18 acetylase RimI-like enzyme
LGFGDALTGEVLDRVEDFYRSHKAPSQVDLTPLHEAEVFEMFKSRGYSIAELNNVLFRGLDPEEEFPEAPTGCEIRRGSPEEARELGGIVEKAFFPDGAPEAYQDLLTPLYRMDGALTFAACVDGKAVACAAGLTIPEHRVFALCGAGTAVGFRGRGLQTALLRRRMKAAAEAGCEYAVVVTNGGSGSQRNCERLGFRVAYSKVTVIKQLTGEHGG